MKKLKDSVNLVVKALDNYSKNSKVGPDNFLDEFLIDVKEKIDIQFVTDVFYGVIQWDSLVKKTTKIFYEIKKGLLEFRDEYLYKVFFYIIVIKLDQISPKDFKSLIKSQEVVKMHHLLSFVFDLDIIYDVLKPEWIKHYDYDLVNSTWIERLKNQRNILEEFLEHIERQALGQSDDDHNDSKYGIATNIHIDRLKKSSKITIPIPFNLSKPLPKTFLDPIKLDNTVKMKEIDRERVFNGTNLVKIEDERKAQRYQSKESVKEKYSKIKPIEFETDKRPMNIERIKAEVEEDLKSKLQFSNKYSQHLRCFSLIPADVHYNETAIIRENFNIEKAKKEEEEKFKQFMIDKTDSREYNKWRREMLENDRLKQKEDVAKRKISAELSRENCQEQKQRKMLMNQMCMAKQKEEELEHTEEKLFKFKKEIADKRMNAKVVIDSRSTMKKERERTISLNKTSFANMIEQNTIMFEKTLEEKRIQTERRNEIIVQIRELEKLPMKRTNFFDPTTVIDHGLLDELSLVELRERLDNQKKLHEEFIKSKREENKLKNAEKQENLLEKAQNISHARYRLHEKKEEERQNKLKEKREKEEAYKELREKNIIEAKKKLEEKKALLRREESNLEKKIMDIKLQRGYLKQSEGRVEEEASKNMEIAVENKLLRRQNSDLLCQFQKESNKLKDIRLIERSAFNEFHEKSLIQQNYHQTMKEHLLLCNEEIIDDQTYKKRLIEKHKELLNISKTSHNEKNLYSTSLLSRNMKTTATFRDNSSTFEKGTVNANTQTLNAISGERSIRRHSYQSKQDKLKNDATLIGEHHVSFRDQGIYSNNESKTNININIFLNNTNNAQNLKKSKWIGEERNGRSQSFNSTKDIMFTRAKELLRKDLIGNGSKELNDSDSHDCNENDSNNRDISLRRKLQNES